ncbi:hypothetical protein DFP72DRAFT_1173673 [Ephemerocybe angulata]|uniref:Anticodon-binding domain-containing protein n=1 Tax=Ephemerocybe angulata TaxID=980116 RepID=A0A8H6HME1_9AGAR|nr:hypothetical protein DFP72DRAFT_1173673 [Tulosesus angulatus]
MLSLLCTVLTRLEVGEFTIKLNNRKILDGIFELDKAPWSEVKREMTEEKCLDPLSPTRLANTSNSRVHRLLPAIRLSSNLKVVYIGGEDLIQTLVADATLMDNRRAKEGVSEMYYLRGCRGRLRAPRLQPGQHFATGPATTTPTPEAATPAPKKKAVKKEAEDELEIDESTVGIGSIAAGGQYDNLVTTIVAGANGVLPGTKLPNVPCIGVSIEMDRIFALVWPKWVEKSVRAKETFVEAGVKTDFLSKTKPKLSAQFAAGEKYEVPFAVIVGTQELAEGSLAVKEQRWVMERGKKVKVESADKGTKVRRSELVEWLKTTGAWAERGTREWA